MNFVRLSLNVLSGNTVFMQVKCASSQFTHLDSDSLWKSVQGVQKKAGGRGKRTKRRDRVDTGRDKILGEGKLGYLWPGLNVPPHGPISKRTEEEQIHWEEERKIRKEERQKRKTKIDILERGWSGGLWGGQLIESRDAKEAEKQFSAYILEARRVSHMTASIGRVYSIRSIVAVGNGNGTFGIGMTTGTNVNTSGKQARTKALKRLRHVERFEDRTLYEDMYVNHHRTFMNIRPQPEGYGLRCHRALITLCKLIGIKDLYVSTMGSTTMLSLIKCFVKALNAQETHQQKADRLGYHIVQCDPLRDNYPVVLASPSGEVKTEPYDEYNAYMTKPLLARHIKSVEGYYKHPWNNILYPTSQGRQIPNSDNIPEIITKIKDATI